MSLSPEPNHPAMKWILIAMVVSMVLIGVVVLAGGLLPREHRVSQSAVVAAPPARAFALLADVAGAASWQGDVYEIVPVASAETVSMEPAASVEPTEPMASTAPAAQTEQFREIGKRGAQRVQLISAKSPAELTIARRGGGVAFRGTWHYRLQPVDEGTRITVTERGEIPNPVFRLLSRVIVGRDRALDAQLTALKAHFASPSDP